EGRRDHETTSQTTSPGRSRHSPGRARYGEIERQSHHQRRAKGTQSAGERRQPPDWALTTLLNLPSPKGAAPWPDVRRARPPSAAVALLRQYFAYRSLLVPNGLQATMQKAQVWI